MTFRPHIRVLFVCALSLSVPAAHAEDQAKKLDDMSLEELLNVQVSVATKTEQTVRTSPAIVTLITAEEIANAGARDLLDVLQMVPGITFGVDVEGVTSLSIRGNWAEEGKALLLWDGQEINEGIYGNLPLGSHFPVDQIKRIEIIRGPGSAVYGGFAELAVINVVTKGAEDLNGVEGHVIYSQMAHAFGQRDVSLAAGKKFNDLVSLSFSAFAGQRNRTQRNYTDVNGNTYSLADNARENPLMLNLGAKIENLEIRLIADLYRTTDRDGYGINTSAPITTTFDSYYAGVKYSYRLTPQMTLIPYFNYKQQLPWEAIGPEPQINSLPDLVFSVRYSRAREGIDYSWDVSPEVNLQAGLVLDQEVATARTDGAFKTGVDQFKFDDQALYSQALWNAGWANLTAGARFNHHSQSGNSFVPRFGVVKQVGDWNFKGLFSKAYRQPTVANIDSNSGIKPENTTVTEFEVGFRISDSSYVTANVFNISIADPIIYSYDATSTTVYQNQDTAGTRGIELQYRLKKSWGYLNASYSFFRPITGGIASYSVPGDDTSLLGEPNHKLAVFSTIETPLEHIRVSPSLIWLTTQWAYTSNGAGGGALTRLSPTFLANLFLIRDDAFVKGLQLGLGVTNILDNDYFLVQPYTVPSPSQPHPPIAAPGGSREVVAKIGYSLPL